MRRQSRFQNLTLLRQDRPYFSQCLVDTLPVWISCGYLWITVVPFLIFLYWKKRPPISFSYLHILKTVSNTYIPIDAKNNVVQTQYIFGHNFQNMQNAYMLRCNLTELLSKRNCMASIYSSMLT